MREIKFRGKQGFDNKWIYGCLLKDKKKYYITNDYGDTFYEVMLEAIGQFTGLYDKNGVEIYEGDVIELKNTFYYDGKYQIIYSEHSMSFVFKAIEKTNYVSLDDIGIDYNVNLGISIEVIGNIYDKGE